MKQKIIPVKKRQSPLKVGVYRSIGMEGVPHWFDFYVGRSLPSNVKFPVYPSTRMPLLQELAIPEHARQDFTLFFDASRKAIKVGQLHFKVYPNDERNEEAGKYMNLIHFQPDLMMEKMPPHAAMWLSALAFKHLQKESGVTHFQTSLRSTKDVGRFVQALNLRPDTKYSMKYVQELLESLSKP